MSKHRFLSGHAWTLCDGYCGFWFRVCGYGLHVSTQKRDDALFSERYGLRKAFYVLGVRVEALTP